MRGFRKFGDALSVMLSKVLAKFGLVSRGKTYYVHYTVGQNGSNDGLTPDQPFKTLDFAVGQCEANKGYKIVLLEGHNEGSTGVIADLDVAGITVIGQGVGSERPTFDYDNAAATIDIGANDITVKNIILRPSVTAVLKGIDIESGVAGTTLEDIEVVEGESAAVDEFVEAICLTSANHYTTLRNIKIRYNLAVDEATSAIRIDAASNYLTFDNVSIIGPTAGGGGTALTAGILEDAAGIQHTVTNCSITNATTNYSFHGSSTFLKRTGNLSDGAPVDTVESLIGADNNNNAVATTNVAANEDGSVLERLEQLQEAVNKGTGTALAANKSLVDALGVDGTATTGVLTTQPGSVFAITKTITQSDIVAAGADLTGVSSGGKLQLIDVVVQNGSTQCDSAGNAGVLELYSDNVCGSASFFTAAEELLLANVAVGMADATTQNSLVLETGKKLQYKATTEDFTSAGTMDVIMIFRRLAAGATIAAA